jgi:NAD(P)H dehydrogenase (quinone)
MHVYIIYAHPSKESFTYKVLKEFTRGLADAGHSFEIGDLYEMNFRASMDIEQYKREMGPDQNAPIPADVCAEQEKINRADALVFVYPLWWSDCPAIMKGWFDKVWALGYAYSYESGIHAPSKIKVKKALVICAAGHPVEYLEETGIVESMRKVMLNDRLMGVGVKEAILEILGGQVLNDETLRKTNLERAYVLGREMFI